MMLCVYATFLTIKCMTPIAQKLREEKQKYTIVRFLYYMSNGIIAFEGKLEQLKVYTINPKFCYLQIIKQRVIANNPTKEVKQNHKIMSQEKAENRNKEQRGQTKPIAI